MNIFETEKINNIKDPIQPIYPERISNPNVLEEKIRLLSDLESGNVPVIELTEKERANIEKFEKNIGEQLEKIYDINIKKITLYNEYFLTEEGKNDFEKVFKKPLEGNNNQEVASFLYTHSQELANLESQERIDLATRSREYSENRLIEDIKKTLDDNGDIDVDKVQTIENVRILLNPSDFRDKIKALRKFKEELKKYKETGMDDDFDNESDNCREAFDKVLALYQSKVNLLLVENYRDVFMIKREADAIGEELLSNEEREMLSEVIGLEREAKNLARYDKLVFGVSRKHNSDGERVQVGEELDEFINSYEDEYLKSVLLGKEAVKSAGIDWEKITAKSVSEDEVIKIAEEVLENYDLLSAYPASEYTKDRIGPAPDNKWQFVMRKEFKSAAVDGDRKVIKCKKGDDNIKHVISVILAHEIEGHVLQHENKSKLPFKIFKKMGSGRTDVLAECGAMENQNHISIKAFNYPSPPKPHYIRAMQKKLRGGNYLDCVREYYKSSIKVHSLEKAGGKISPEEFKIKCEKKIKTAIGSSRRLFREANDFSARDKFLASSKDTVYAEQVILFRELKKNRLEKYVFILGANLDVLIFLKKFGYLDSDKILQPKQCSIDIWNRIKEKYKID